MLAKAKAAAVWLLVDCGGRGLPSGLASLLYEAETAAEGFLTVDGCVLTSATVDTTFSA